MMSQRSVAFILCSLFASALLTLAKLPCEESGYCSEGKVQPFMGDMSTAEGLRALLHARSYKREIVLIAGSIRRLDVNLAAVRSLERLGLHNHFFMAMSAHVCTAISELAPGVACGYYKDADTKRFGPLQPHSIFMLWSLRYRTIARVVRLGYNVMMADGDSLFFHDPYRFFKHPVLREFNVINQCESGPHERCYSANGGILYFQNCRPDGPAVWMIHEAIDRPLRYHQDMQWLAAHPFLSENDMLMDQSGLNMALIDSFSGKALHEVAHSQAHMTKRGTARFQRITEAIKAEARLNNEWVLEPRSVPDDWAQIVGGNSTKLFWRHMHVPVEPSSPELAGLGNPGPRAGAAAEMREQLVRDCPACPWWPDPDNASMAARVQAIPPEKFLVAPVWLFSSWISWGSQGWWNADLVPMVRQVLGHMHFLPKSESPVKRILVMMLGFYDWSVRRSPAAAKHGLQPFPCGAGNNVRVLALHPDADLGWMRGTGDLQQVLVGLQLAAQASQRMVVWPLLPCLDWMHSGPANIVDGKEMPPYYYEDEVCVFGRPGKLKCYLARTSTHACASDGNGMTGFEFEELLRRVGSSAQPSTANTVDLAAGTNATGGSSRLQLLTFDHAAKALAAAAGAQVMYLRSPVSIDQASIPQKDLATITSMLKKCPLTNTNSNQALFFPRSQA